MTAFTWPSNSTGSTTMLSGVRLAQAGADLDVVVRHVGEQDASPSPARTGPPALRRTGTGLANRSCAPCMHSWRSASASASLFADLVDVEDPCCAFTSGASSDSTICGDGQQIALALQHAGEPRHVRLQPVLLVFLRVVSLRLAIISLMLSFRAATSPCASTAIDRVRSPFVTAVATSAMARTCVVSFAAS